MSGAVQPVVFVSHGSPMIMFEPSPARDFLSGLGERFGRPDAILVVSAHHDLDHYRLAPDTPIQAVVTGSATPPTIHDFGGFPQKLFDVRYPAPGKPELADQVAKLVQSAGIGVAIDPERGLDHGAWVPLALGWPEADVPVVQLSINSSLPPEFHQKLGQALSSLRAQNVLILASGSLTHNLRAVALGGRNHDAEVPEWVSAFSDWVRDRFAAGEATAVLNAVTQAPYGRENHPTMDHILPLFVAIGAGGDHVTQLHHSYTYGVLSMDAYRFD